MFGKVGKHRLKSSIYYIKINLIKKGIGISISARLQKEGGEHVARALVGPGLLNLIKSWRSITQPEQHFRAQDIFTIVFFK